MRGASSGCGGRSSRRCSPRAARTRRCSPPRSTAAARHPRGPAEQEYFQRWRLPEQGFRNYWYPVLLSRDLTSRPQKRRLLGEDVVLWRDGGQAHALADRCPHRGASLAAGHVRFPLGDAELSVSWVDVRRAGGAAGVYPRGPDSRMVGKVRTPAYPVAERLGVVWVWIGDQAPVPVEEDLPVGMTVPGVHNFIHFTPVWRTNWALLFDNFIDGLPRPTSTARPRSFC